MQQSLQHQLALTALSALAGAIHVLAPDHWVPLSILSWQRRWRSSRASVFTSLALLVHVFSGVALYFFLEKWLQLYAPSRMFGWAVAAVILILFLRGSRFSKIRDVQRVGPQGVWGPILVFSFLGPCESMVPILIKASSWGVGYLLPTAAFLVGSLLTGNVLVLAGRRAWSYPILLSRFLDRVTQWVMFVPLAAAMALGFRYVFRLG